MVNSAASVVFPERGFVFWPVGTGDSTTIVLSDTVIVQVDLHHLECAEDDDDHRTPILDRLVELLPKVAGKPYLSAFVLTHPDEDHCCGFTELLKRVTIGELWFSPRVFREYKKDLCSDAQAFCKEATRRVKKVISAGGAAAADDRVRIIGYDELLQEDEYSGFPKSLLTVPGNAVVMVDGVDQSAIFRAFIHAPFKDDCASERNDTSIAMQVRLSKDGGAGQCLLLGDHCYPVLSRIFKLSDASDVAWSVLLAPHHCSKSAMYWCDSQDQPEVLKQDILDAMQAAQEGAGHIVASSEPIPETNEPGDCPPHAKAKHRYQEIAAADFICTQEHPDTTNPEPVIFEVSAAGVALTTTAAKSLGERPVAAAVTAARGSDEPPRDRVGFGLRR